MIPGGRALVVAVLLSYLALTGEAIHCQYFAHDHDAHQHSSVPAKDHKAHCAVAGHCSAAAIQTASITGVDPIQVAALLFHSTPALAGFSVSLSSSPRAPPSVFLSV
jgi:hypothetical protein